MIKFYTWAIYREPNFVQQLDVPPFSEANMNCGSNLDEDSERENVYI